jgi:protein-L-isoaspartate(D-aspartate) O-methyltransferase
MNFERAQMVELQLRRRGISDPRLLRAFLDVPREEFVPADERRFAYEDSPLPIPEGQTISQPFVVAVTASALRLRPTDRVLEVGTGSGYAAAVLSRLAAEVYTVERHAPLATEATVRLERLGYSNVHVRYADGTLGWPEHAPFDAIAVAAASPEVPRPLLEQLAVGGRLVIPVGSAQSQVLTSVTQPSAGVFRSEAIMPVQFVPLIGAQGWADHDEPRS